MSESDLCYHAGVRDAKSLNEAAAVFQRLKKLRLRSKNSRM